MQLTMQHNSFFAMALSALLVLGLVGCSDPDSRYSRVEGTVTYNGQPVDGATVRFQSVDPEGESASGATDAEGRFTLTSTGAKDGGRGVLPGEYTVLVIKYEQAPPDPDQEAYNRGDIDYNELQARLNRRPPVTSSGVVARSLVPAKYGTPRTSDLTATVQPGKNDPFNFELVD